MAAKKDSGEKRKRKQDEVTTEAAEQNDNGADNGAPIVLPPAEGTVGDADYGEVMANNFMLYAKSVLVDRALPSIDGLKPVQRRILLAMLDRRLYPTAAYSKSAKVVGDTMGKYHPHGDAAIYGALVNMAQDFTSRVPLIDGHGNFGSLDGDAAAAQRYTECRMTQAAVELLADLHEKVIPDYYGMNFDESAPEPQVLPARWPNVLVNGTTGIAVGMATTILPHNPAEVIDLCVWRLKNPKAPAEKLVERLSGPDFPTGATVLDDEGLRESYLTGKGKVTALAKAHIEPIEGNREKIVITEIPWGVNKGDLLTKIAKQHAEGKFPEITELNDFSRGDDEIRVEAILKWGANSRAVLQRLLKHTGLRKVYGVEMNVLIEGVPKTVSLAELVDHFLEFRRQVVINRAKKRIEEIEERLHRLDAYMKVVAATDKVVQTIRKAKDRQAAKKPLMKLLKVDEQQAQWIVEMQLGQLTQLDRFKLKEEVKVLKEELKGLKQLVRTPKLVTEAMIEEFGEVKEGFKKAGLTERHTSVMPPSDGEDIATMSVPAEDCILLISRSGRAICGQGTLKRGASLNLSSDDRLAVVEEGRTDQERLVFTASGRAYRLRLAELPLESRRSKGAELAQIIGVEQGDPIVAAHEFTAGADGAKDGAVLLVSRDGVVKRTAWKEFASAHASGITAGKVGPGDEIITALDCPDDADIVLLGSHGKAIRFAASEARLMGRNAGGVRGIRLPEGAQIVAAAVIRPEDENGGQLLLATTTGFAKRVPYSELPKQGRGGGGVALMKVGGKYGEPKFAAPARDGQTLYVEVGGGRFKIYPVSRVAKTRKRAIVPKRWPSGEHAVGVVLADD